MSYVVLEWNQASGRPQIFVDELFDTLQEANEVANAAREELKPTGRRERYTVHQVDMDECDR